MKSWIWTIVPPWPGLRGASGGENGKVGDAGRGEEGVEFGFGLGGIAGRARRVAARRDGQTAETGLAAAISAARISTREIVPFPNVPAWSPSSP